MVISKTKPPSDTPPNTPHTHSTWRAVDWHIKAKIKLCRNVQNLSQEELAGLLGITTERLQEYESGVRKVEASRLWMFSKVLNVPLKYFFDGTEETEETDEEITDSTATILDSEESIAVVKSFCNINDPTIRDILLKLMRAIEKSK